MRQPLRTGSRLQCARRCAGRILATMAIAATAGCGTEPADSIGPRIEPGARLADAPGNDAPIVRIERDAEPIVLEPGGEVALVGSVDDPDHKGTEAPALQWDFGDGATAEGPTPPPHRYPEVGRYLVTLSATDASGARATPAVRLVEVGRPEPPRGNHALRLLAAGRDDIDRVKIPQDDPSGMSGPFAANIGATDITIELWLRAAPGDNPAPPADCADDEASWIYGNIVIDRDRWGPGRSYGLSLAAGIPVFGLVGRPVDAERVTLCATTAVDDDTWHHIAITRSVGTGAVALFVDGRLEASVDEGPIGDMSYPPGARPGPHCPGELPCTISDPYLVLGAEKHDAGPEFPSFRGLIDEVRLSTTIRYTGPFTPPTRRFEPDDRTAALYHLDDAGGPIASDSATVPGAPTHGIVRYGGDPVGPVWVVSDAPTG
jgi:hypothetical protein